MSGLEKKHTENEGREKEKHKKDKKGKKRKKSSQNKNMTAEKLSKLDDATGEGFYQQSYQAKQSQSVAPYTHAVASTSQMSVERERNVFGRTSRDARGSIQDTGEDGVFETIMTDSHKKRINSCCKPLVDNMDVEDVVNHLRSADVLTPRDSEEIRVSGWRSKQAQTLLDILLRKPDRAFGELVDALKSAKQSHVAHLLVREEKSVTLKTELTNVTMGIAAATQDRTATFVKMIFDRMQIELQRLEDKEQQGDPRKSSNLHVLKMLTDMGREITDPKLKCILLTVRCPTLAALHDLINKVTRKQLQESFAETFVTKEWKASHGIESIDVQMTICPLEYAQCEQELSSALDRTQDHSLVTKKDEQLPQATTHATRIEADGAQQGSVTPETSKLYLRRQQQMSTSSASAIRKSEMSSLKPSTSKPGFKCGICLEDFRDPRGLPCFHTFCLNCLSNLAARTRPADGTLKCPTCRHQCTIPGGNVNNFPKNMYLSSELEPTTGSHSQNVDASDRQAKIDATQDAIEFEFEKGARNKEDDHCERHPTQKIECYCRTCALPACSKCLQDEHVDHTTEQLSVMQVKLQRDLNEISKMAAKRITSLHQTGIDLEKAESNIRSDIYNAKQDIIDGMYSLVRYHERLLQVKVDMAEESVGKHMAEAKTELEDSMKKTSRLKSLADNSAMSDAPFTTVLQTTDIKQQLLNQQDIPVPGVQHSVDKMHVKAADLLSEADINIKQTSTHISSIQYPTVDVSLGSPLQTIRLDCTGTGPVVGISPLHKTMICVAHSGEEYIWVYSTEGQLKQKIQVPGIAKIYGVVAIDGNEGKLAIVADTSSIQFVTLSIDLEVLQHTTKDVSVNPDRISIGCNKQLIVNHCRGNKLIVLSADGEILSIVEAAIPLDNFRVNATQTNSGFVICDYMNKKVYFADVNGHVVHTPTDCVDPRRAVHTSWGHVIIVDYTGNEVRVFSEAGEFLGNVHDSNGSITYPHYVHVDETERLMYVARGKVEEFELRTYKFAPTDLPSLPMKRNVTKLELTVKLAKL